MICKNCGADIPDTSKFCPACGAETDLPEEEKSREDPEQPENGDSGSPDSDWWGSASGTEDPDEEADDDLDDDPDDDLDDDPDDDLDDDLDDDQPGRRRTGLIAGIIIAAVVVIAAVVAVIIVFSGGKPTIDLDEYLTFSTEGYDGYGVVDFKIDKDGIAADYAGKLKLTNQGRNEQPDADPVSEVTAGISGTLSRSTGLSNGDTVMFTWNIDKSVQKNVDVVLKYTDTSVEVEELPSLEPFDAFEDVTVYFTGREPNGQADIQVNVVNNPLGSQGYTLDKQYGLSNGDIVTVTISDELAESYAREQGKIPLTMSKEYMVKGLTDAADTEEDTAATPSAEPSASASQEPSTGTTAAPVPSTSASGGTQTVTVTPSYVTSLSQVPSDAVSKMSEPVPALVAKHCGNREELLSYSYIGCYLMNDSAVHNKLYLVYYITVNETYEGQSQTVGYYWFICYQSAMIDQYGNFSIDYSSYTTPEILEKDYAYHKGIWVGYTLNGHEFQYPGTATLDELISKMREYGSNAYVLDSTVWR